MTEPTPETPDGDDYISEQRAGSLSSRLARSSRRTTRDGFLIGSLGRTGTWKSCGTA
ncbi:hypothetical protein NKH18_01110 [Streptomyces sp. M10(2022)]